MDVRHEAMEAMKRLGRRLPVTPVVESPSLGRTVGCRLFLKLENRQPTGSFKIRGVMNRLLAMTPEQRRMGVVAASTGNHGLALAHASNELAVPALVFAPRTALPAKLDAIRSAGLELRLAGDDCLVAEQTARRYAREHDMLYVSPYNDPRVVGGQATIGIELEQQLDRVDAVVASLGGGGLIGGVGGYLRSSARPVIVVAASPRNSPVMHLSIKAGRVLDLPSQPTLSDGTAGGVEHGAVTFDLCRATIDHSLLIDEDAILAAVRMIERDHGMLVEGAAGVAVAGFLAAGPLLRGLHVAVVICGGNADPGLRARLLDD
jgi:threonine dehydratase